MHYSKFSEAVFLLGGLSNRLWCEWVKEEERDRPGWRSLELVSVPKAWANWGASVWETSPLIPLRAKQHVRGTGGRDRRRMRGSVMGVFATYLQYTRPRRRLSKSAGLTSICLIPGAIRQFSWEMATKINICLSVSTYQRSSVCVPPLVDSIFKS